jgi:excisionase family DNA binding protein
MNDRLLEAAEVAELLNVPVTWVREQTRSGAIPCVELGRYRRYDGAEVLAWLESLKTGGGPAFRRHRPIGRVPG